LSFVSVDGRLGSTYPASFPRTVTKITATHCYHSRCETRAGKQCRELLRASFAALVSAVGTTVHYAGRNGRERFALNNRGFVF